MADLVQVSQVEFYKQRLEVNMSAILQGADKAYLKEYTESADEKRLYALQDAMGTVRKTTKGGKYLGSDVIDILVQVQQLAEKFGIPQDELDYFENQVRQAQNNLEYIGTRDQTIGAIIAQNIIRLCIMNRNGHCFQVQPNFCQKF